MTAGGQAAFEGGGAAVREGGGVTHWPLGVCGQLRPCHFRPEVQDLDGAPPCPGLAGGKPEDAEEEEEDELEDDGDSLAGRSQDDTVCPTPEPQAACEDEEDGPASLAMGFDHTRRWAPAPGPRVPHAPGGPRSHTHHPPSGVHPPSQQAFLLQGLLCAGGGEAGPPERGSGLQPPTLARARKHTLPQARKQSGGGDG